MTHLSICGRPTMAAAYGELIRWQRGSRALVLGEQLRIADPAQVHRDRSDRRHLIPSNLLHDRLRPLRQVSPPTRWARRCGVTLPPGTTPLAVEIDQVTGTRPAKPLLLAARGTADIIHRASLRAGVGP